MVPCGTLLRIFWGWRWPCSARLTVVPVPNGWIQSLGGDVARRGGQGWIWVRMSSDDNECGEDDNVNIDLSWSRVIPNGGEECGKSFRQPVLPHNWSFQPQTPPHPLIALSHPICWKFNPPCSLFFATSSGPLSPTIREFFHPLTNLLKWWMMKGQCTDTLTISCTDQRGDLTFCTGWEFPPLPLLAPSSTWN